MNQESWYKIDDIDELDSPALVLFTDRVRENIHTLVSMVDDVQRVRPHVKTHKTIDATKLMMNAGVNKFKCATIAEAEMLGIAGAADVLLAYQPVGPKLKRFLCVIENYPATNYSCLVDNIIAATEISNFFSSHHKKIKVYLDVNVGQNRTGITAGPDAVDLYVRCASLPGLLPVGLHEYDGHIRDKDFEMRKKNCDEAFARVEKIQKEIKEKGFPEPIIVAGGSPTFSIHSKRKIIECSPGTFVYWDKGYLELCPEQDFKPAALVISRVISLPSPGKICVDLGHKSIAAENEITRRVYFINAPELKPISQSEEHLVLEAPNADHNFVPGDVLYGIPYHVCPTIALYERALTIEDAKITGEWKNISRDRKINC
ncbi:MAG: threonine aldolase [Bacteroidetes bacterium]|nr:MAG: threonine aldolase [Bacteroidota bacterium]